MGWDWEWLTPLTAPPEGFTSHSSSDPDFPSIVTSRSGSSSVKNTGAIPDAVVRPWTDAAREKLQQTGLFEKLVLGDVAAEEAHHECCMSPPWRMGPGGDAGEGGRTHDPNLT